MSGFPKDNYRSFTDEIEVLQQQLETERMRLAEAQAALVLKDEALKFCADFLSDFAIVPKIQKALAVQPGTEALEKWLGEPVAWTHSCPVLCLDDVELWIDKCPHCGKPAPKGEVE